MEEMGAYAWKILQYAVECWNKMVNAAISYLTMDMETASEAISVEGGSIITVLMHFEESIFVPVACSLVLILYICRLFNESLDFKDSMTLEKFAEGVIKVGIAQALICNCRQIVTALFQVGINFVSFMSGDNANITNSLQITLDDAWGDVFVNMDILPGAVFLIFNFFAFIIVFASGIVLLFTIIMRFFKIFCMLPFGILSYSTVVGGRELNASAKAFTKYILLCVLEGILIVAALKLSSQWAGLGLQQLGLTDSTFVVYTASGAIDNSQSGGVLEGIVAILDVVVPIIGVVGFVKIAQRELSKVLAL